MTSITIHAAQPPADVAVVMPTILQPGVLRAARSVFRQAFDGRIHLLVGVDVAQGDPSLLDAIRAECPPGFMLTVLDLGYSTSRRHGGVHANAYSGSLRALLSFAANSRLVAYLDDNDWYAAPHLTLMREAVAGRDWAFAQRWLVDPATEWPICIDEWDSVGPGRGINAAGFGGFVQPSTLMLDKLSCAHALPAWACSPFADGSGEDRLVFEALRERPYGEVANPTVFCSLNRDSIGHDHHLAQFAARGLDWITERPLVRQLLARLDEAHALLAARDVAGAASAVEAALAIHPFHAGAIRLHGRVLALQDQPEQAALREAQARLLVGAA